jgi:hypothetical protein
LDRITWAVATAVAVSAAALAPSAVALHTVTTERLLVAQQSNATPPAENLRLTTVVTSQLVKAAAAFFRLPASDFVGLQPGTAYYGYEVASSTYWAGAGLLPSSKSMQAQVVVQDDGAYLIFHRPPGRSWVVQEVGYQDIPGVCARTHVSLPASIASVWHWMSGTCHPPAAPLAGSPSANSKAAG